MRQIFSVLIVAVLSTLTLSAVAAQSEPEKSSCAVDPKEQRGVFRVECGGEKQRLGTCMVYVDFAKAEYKEEILAVLQEKEFNPSRYTLAPPQLPEKRWRLTINVSVIDVMPWRHSLEARGYQELVPPPLGFDPPMWDLERMGPPPW